MGKINRNNMRKTIYYLQKNGLKDTFYAVRERLEKRAADEYTYTAPDDKDLERQRRRRWENPVCFSIVVPVYRTPEEYFREMVQSVLGQSYPYFQLILVDASGDDSVERQWLRFEDSRIRYYKLNQNMGISENTNVGLMLAEGDYVALLDHDDVLAGDALYEFASAIEDGKQHGVEYKMLYSDEDKCNGDQSRYYEPNFKPDFDLDLLLTNNYICHFTAIKTELIRQLKLRKEYDGAQDFDLFLRTAALAGPGEIRHIARVLYHWRCHDASTAANPESKRYAYEAGLRAVQNFCDSLGWHTQVVHQKHLGFYKVNYLEGVFADRPEVTAFGGSLVDRRKKRIVGGMMQVSHGSVCQVVYRGLPIGYSGYMNRAVLTRQAEVLDIRCISVRPQCREIFEKIAGVPYREAETGDGRLLFDWHCMPGDTDFERLSVEVSRALREHGGQILWVPEIRTIC